MPRDGAGFLPFRNVEVGRGAMQRLGNPHRQNYAGRELRGAAAHARLIASSPSI